MQVRRGEASALAAVLKAVTAPTPEIFPYLIKHPAAFRSAGRASRLRWGCRSCLRRGIGRHRVGGASFPAAGTSWRARELPFRLVSELR